jgi:hypothetical protein
VERSFLAVLEGSISLMLRSPRCEAAERGTSHSALPGYYPDGHLSMLLSHPVASFVIGNNIAVVRELLSANRTDPVSLDNLLIEHLPHFRR